MRRAVLTLRLVDIWAGTWPAPTLTAAIILLHSWLWTISATVVAALIVHRYWRRRDYHQNIENTVELLIRHYWPHQDLKLIHVKADGPFTLPQILAQRHRTKRWGAPVHKLTLTVWGQLDQAKIAEWARIHYEFATPETTPSLRSQGAWDITLTHTQLPDKVMAT